uniref:Putative odorant binding protein 20 n=1 Tax=Corcyra cephalonica TaxID=139036 RepID=A0A8K1P952_CORCP|nr:putative odorant binding protein 20 [Corcyra cephalonica]
MRCILTIVGVCLAFSFIDGVSSKEPVYQFVDGFMKQSEKCNEEFNLSMSDLKKLKAGTLDNINPCFFACILKNFGMIDDMGMYQQNENNEEFKKTFESDADMKKFNNDIKECESVNKENVSDGNKGCERSVKLLDCVENMFPTLKSPMK